VPIEAVIFDIGNVLIEWRPAPFYDSVIGPERRRALFAQSGLMAMNDAIDRGAPFGPTVRALAAAEPAWRDEIMMWHDRWIEMVSPVIPHSVRLMRALRAEGVPVFALSNFGDQTFDLAQTHYPFLTEFDRAYVSGKMGVMKPEAAIYARLEEDCGLAPSGLLFVDDKAENTEAAQARGWQTHLFIDPQGWADRLVAEGLLAREAAA